MRKFSYIIALMVLFVVPSKAQYAYGTRYIIKEYSDTTRESHDILVDFSSIQGDIDKVNSQIRSGEICFFSGIALDGIGTLSLCLSSRNYNNKEPYVIVGCACLGVGTIISIVGLINWCDGIYKRGRITTAMNRVILSF